MYQYFPVIGSSALLAVITILYFNLKNSVKKLQDFNNSIKKVLYNLILFIRMIQKIVVFNFMIITPKFFFGRLSTYSV